MVSLLRSFGLDCKSGNAKILIRSVGHKIDYLKVGRFFFFPLQLGQPYNTFAFKINYQVLRHFCIYIAKFFPPSPMSIFLYSCYRFFNDKIKNRVLRFSTKGQENYKSTR